MLVCETRDDNGEVNVYGLAKEAKAARLLLENRSTPFHAIAGHAHFAIYVVHSIGDKFRVRAHARRPNRCGHFFEMPAAANGSDDSQTQCNGDLNVLAQRKDAGKFLFIDTREATTILAWVDGFLLSMQADTQMMTEIMNEFIAEICLQSNKEDELAASRAEANLMAKLRIENLGQLTSLQGEVCWQRQFQCLPMAPY